VNAKVGLGPFSRSLARCLDTRADFVIDGERRTRLAWAAPPPSPARTGEAKRLRQPSEEDGRRAQQYCEVAEDPRNGSLHSSRR
jgi:hypothetical protein